jgi:hypothetical protein
MRLGWLLLFASTSWAQSYGYGPQPGYVVPARPAETRADQQMHLFADQLVRATAELHAQAEDALYRGEGDRQTVAVLERLSRLSARFALDSGAQGAASPLARDDFEQLLRAYRDAEDRVGNDASFQRVRMLMDRLLPAYRG